jgi:hypothetical protein
MLLDDDQIASLQFSRPCPVCDGVMELSAIEAEPWSPRTIPKAMSRPERLRPRTRRSPSFQRATFLGDMEIQRLTYKDMTANAPIPANTFEVAILAARLWGDPSDDHINPPPPTGRE